MTATPPDYEALEPLGGTSLRVRFGGTFNGATTRWDATFLTLAHYRANDAAVRRNFIDIGNAGPEGRRLMVVLDVPAFDAATVTKTIIMVRNYRRLRLGRHWFGAEQRFDPA